MRYLLIILCFLSSCRPFVKPVSGLNINIRVLLAGAKNLTIHPEGEFIIDIGGTTSIIGAGKISASHTSEGMIINGIPITNKSVSIYGTSTFEYNNNRYRGYFSLHQDKKNIQLVNHIHLEEYLLSVIPAEVYPSWSKETLKAQAIASRTYALYELKRNNKEIFDVYSDTRSQVYKGIKSENERTSKVILETTGQVLTYNEELIKSYFSASVGVKSADGDEIGNSAPYLQSKNLPIFSHPHFHWKTSLSFNKLQKKLGMKQSIKNILIEERTPSNRIGTIKVIDATNKPLTITGEKFRSIVGHGVMKSTYATIQIKNSNITIEGRGFGHGVGMGQWEAQSLAQKGASHLNILAYFYQGTRLNELY